MSISLIGAENVFRVSVKTFIPATEPPDPRSVFEGFLKGSLKVFC